VVPGLNAPLVRGSAGASSSASGSLAPSASTGNLAVYTATAAATGPAAPVPKAGPTQPGQPGYTMPTTVTAQWLAGVPPNPIQTGAEDNYSNYSSRPSEAGAQSAAQELYDYINEQIEEAKAADDTTQVGLLEQMLAKKFPTGAPTPTQVAKPPSAPSAVNALQAATAQAVRNLTIARKSLETLKANLEASESQVALCRQEVQRGQAEVNRCLGEFVKSQAELNRYFEQLQVSIVADPGGDGQPSPALKTEQKDEQMLPQEGGDGEATAAAPANVAGPTAPASPASTPTTIPPKSGGPPAHKEEEEERKSKKSRSDSRSRSPKSGCSSEARAQQLNNEIAALMELTNKPILDPTIVNNPQWQVEVSNHCSSSGIDLQLYLTKITNDKVNLFAERVQKS